MLLLHIVATPRAVESNTLRISRAFVDRLQIRYPELRVDTLDLFTDHLPAVDAENVESKYALMTGQAIDQRHADSWKNIEALTRQFLAADIYLISVPMWNFGVPYALKYYIDAVVQPGHLFSYEGGVPVGLCRGKQMVCVTSRGGDYSPGTMLHAYDLQEPYLRTVFGFVGITDVQFVNAQPMDVSPELREAAIGDAIEAVHRLAAQREWSDPGADEQPSTSAEAADQVLVSC
jgi:FMN-dependent NADH-azoreductase